MRDDAELKPERKGREDFQEGGVFGKAAFAKGRDTNGIVK
jgi:hypothetical protein